MPSKSKRRIHRRCKCGCGLVPKKLGSKWRHGHNPARIGTGKRHIRRRCKCGCGKITAPGKKWITGHNIPMKCIMSTGYSEEWADKEYIKSCMGDCCEICGSIIDLLPHHKDHDKTNNHPKNIGTWCRSCHCGYHIVFYHHGKERANLWLKERI